jgi:DGQHR domain-containing protein
MNCQMANSKTASEKPQLFDAVQITQRNKDFYLTCLPAEVLTSISYVAERGKTDEQGAVQRILNKRRINSIKEYTLKGGDYPSSVVLNWVSQKRELRFADGKLRIPCRPRSAQVIDGQHRIAGIKEAIASDPDVGRLQIPVTMYTNLGTKECANIFLAINTEQKPVSKSLVYDLYGVASEFLVDYAASRARDIAVALNSQEESPYFELVREPTSRARSGISLATIVTALKPLVAEKGTFEQVGIKALEQQCQVVINFFNSLKTKYGSNWDSRTNAFMYAAGFVGGVEFLRRKMFDYCFRLRSFSEEVMSSAVEMDESNLITQDEIKGLGGAKARETVADRLVSMFEPATNDGDLQF